MKTMTPSMKNYDEHSYKFKRSEKHDRRVLINLSPRLETSYYLVSYFRRKI